MNNHRYPGAKPFEKEDKAIFFGRETDTRKLHELISVERMVVLYGKSGLGKSSLLNAGVLPLFSNYSIIPIRFQAKAEGIASPLETLLAKIQAESLHNEEFIEKFASELAPVWAKLNALQTTKKPQCICLVFDQFEELFTHDKADIFRFKTALAEAFFEKVPQKVRTKWENERANLSEQAQKQIFQPIEIKIIFGIRDDRMSFLDELKDVFPNILQKTYKLAPLNRAQAEEAILYPAYAKGEDFKVKPFDYEDEALDAILDTLSNNRQEIESPQLQIICRHAEFLVENGKISPNEKGRVVVHLRDLGDLRQVYRDYYLAMLHSIENEQERANVQQVIENELVYEPEERRIPCFEKVILDKGVSLKTLRWLVDEHHILRSEPNVGGGFTYELSHDVLVKPILAVKKVRIAETEKIRLEKEKAEAEKAAQLAQAQAENDRILRENAEQATKRARKFSIIAGTLAVVAIAALIWAIFAAVNANSATLQAKAATIDALQKKRTSDSLKIVANKQTEEAIKAKNAADSAKVETNKALIKAYEFELNRCKEQFSLAKSNSGAFHRLQTEYLAELEKHKADSLDKRRKKIETMIDSLQQIGGISR